MREYHKTRSDRPFFLYRFSRYLDDSVKIGIQFRGNASSDIELVLGNGGFGPRYSGTRQL